MMARFGIDIEFTAPDGGLRMATLFVISNDSTLREACRTALRKLNVQTTFCIDHIEGMKEMGWVRPDLIVWDMDPANPRDVRGLTVLREKRPMIPLFLMVPDEKKAAELVAGKANRLLDRFFDVDELVAIIAKELDLKPNKASKPKPPVRKESYDFDYDLDPSEASK